MARIMVVDDDENLLSFLAEALKIDGYEVIACKAGEDALSQFHVPNQQFPDLILSDVAMPGLDGFAFLDMLKQNPRTSRIPVIMMTAQGDIHPELKSSPNLAAFLPKPFSLAVLLETVEKALRPKRP